VDNTLTPAVTFAGSDSLGVAGFECALDAAAFTTCASPLTLAITGEGNHTFKVRARDAAGNADASPATASWLIDLSAPDTTISAGPGAGSTSAATGSFAFTATDAT